MDVREMVDEMFESESGGEGVRWDYQVMINGKQVTQVDVDDDAETITLVARDKRLRSAVVGRRSRMQ